MISGSPRWFTAQHCDKHVLTRRALFGTLPYLVLHAQVCGQRVQRVPRQRVERGGGCAGRYLPPHDPDERTILLGRVLTPRPRRRRPATKGFPNSFKLLPVRQAGALHSSTIQLNLSRFKHKSTP